jgi:hypothetical protein
MSAQDEKPPNFHVVVDLVQLNVAVTDNKGNYVTGLKPSDFVLSEDGIRQKIATFGEGNQAPQALIDFAKDQSEPKTVEPETELHEAAPVAEGQNVSLTPAITCTADSPSRRMLSRTS